MRMGWAGSVISGAPAVRVPLGRTGCGGVFGGGGGGGGGRFWGGRGGGFSGWKEGVYGRFHRAFYFPPKNANLAAPPLPTPPPHEAPPPPRRRARLLCGRRLRPD